MDHRCKQDIVSRVKAYCKECGGGKLRDAIDCPTKECQLWVWRIGLEAGTDEYAKRVRHYKERG